ncbi:MAG: trigger factor [Clostridiales bacterium]|jgi:trigger factor|nr:trigger factor [Clostridiales bacterium]
MSSENNTAAHDLVTTDTIDESGLDIGNTSLITGYTTQSIDPYTVKLTINISPQDFAKSIEQAYKSECRHYHIQGFRPGKAPRKLIERQYGSDVFFEKAIELSVDDLYSQAVEELDLNVVFKPKLSSNPAISESGVTLNVDLMVMPKPIPGEYKGITVPEYDINPTAEEINEIINTEREKNARIYTVERPSQMGDVVIINFTGYVDDKPFEGGHDDGYELTLGSHTFIDTFEDQLVGQETGESVFVRVTFPENYGNAELAGKPATFDVYVIEIREKQLPEMDDDFAQDISEFETFEEYRNDVINSLRQKKVYEGMRFRREAISAEIINRTQIDLPPALVEARLHTDMHRFEHELEDEDVDLNQYLTNLGMSREEFHEQFKQRAERELKEQVAFAELVKKENIKPTAEELEQELEDVGRIYNLKRNQINIEAVVDLLIKRKAVDYATEHAAKNEIDEYIDNINPEALKELTEIEATEIKTNEINTNEIETNEELDTMKSDE